MHVMVDIETLGKGGDALILSIGACVFDPSRDLTDAITSSFYVAVDPASAEAYGGKMDADTVMWWMHGDRDVPRAAMVNEPRVDLISALEAFSMWVKDAAGTEPRVWGNGATFDNIIIRRAYERAGVDLPWQWWNDRCYRTIKNVGKHIPMYRSGIHHNAVDDAITQAQHLVNIVQQLNLTLN